MTKKIHPGNNDLNILSLFNGFQISLKVGLYSGCDSDVTDLQCRFQHRYPITATTHVITKQHELKTIVATRQKGNDFAMLVVSLLHPNNFIARRTPSINPPVLF